MSLVSLSRTMLLFGLVARCNNPCGSRMEEIPASGKLLRRSRSARLELSDPACSLDRSMLDETDNLLRDIGAELVFGLVAPVGADLDRLEADLVDLLGL